MSSGKYGKTRIRLTPLRPSFPTVRSHSSCYSQPRLLVRYPYLLSAFEWQADIDRASGTGPPPTLRLLKSALALDQRTVNATNVQYIEHDHRAIGEGSRSIALQRRLVGIDVVNAPDRFEPLVVLGGNLRLHVMPNLYSSASRWLRAVPWVIWSHLGPKLASMLDATRSELWKLLPNTSISPLSRSRCHWHSRLAHGGCSVPGWNLVA